VNTLELDAHAEGLFKYLSDFATPLDSIAILGVALLKVYDAGTNHEALPIAQFAEDIRASLVESYTQRSSQGPETRQ
jgi:hypothetical protein